MMSLIDGIRGFHRLWLKIFIKDKDKRKSLEISIMQKALRNPVYKFIDCWLISIVWTAWALVHYRFNKDKIMRDIDLKRAEMKRELRIVNNENVQLTAEKRELNRKLKQQEEDIALLTRIENMYKDEYANTRKQ